MPNDPSVKPKNTPDAILAHVQLLRATDRLLVVADELRTARDKLHDLLALPQEGHQQEASR